MDPLIKWPGGKRREVKQLVPLIPPGAIRIVEPFAGGAALAFALEPVAALLNDVDPDLIAFYQRLASADPDVGGSLRDIAGMWATARTMTAGRADDLLELFVRKCSDEQLLRVAKAWADEVNGTAPSFLAGGASLRRDVHRSLASKLARLPALRKSGMTDDQTREQFRTALLAGLYTHVRDTYSPHGAPCDSAVFWFLRELCFGSLMRYNRSGRSNVPYGGASYNSIDLEAKTERLLALGTTAFMRRVSFSALDFREFFATYVPRAGDLCFIDPPYLGGFSAYGGRAFGREDHADLAQVVATLPVPALVVVGADPLVDLLYRRPGLTISSYDHTYGSNLRGRNDRAARHVVITNYEPALSKQAA